MNKIVYRKTHSKTNVIYDWCELCEDGSLKFGYEDKVVLSIHSYEDINKYYNEVSKKLGYYKRLYPFYYIRILNLGSYITKGYSNV